MVIYYNIILKLTHSLYYFNKNKKIAVDKWRCKVCILKRELAKKSGQWTLEQQQQQHQLQRQPDIFIDKLNVTIAKESGKNKKQNFNLQYSNY